MARIRLYLDLIRFEHTLFALPFAYVGVLLAASGRFDAGVWLWVTVAMVGARTAAMALNRLIDWKIDALNPRTANRHLPRGLVRPWETLTLALVGFALLAWSAYNLNPLTARLLPIAVLFLTGYSYTKRFTWTCHFWLGVTIGAAAAGGWIAQTGYFEPGAYALWAAVALWIAGFDILYATQDVEFDRKHGVHALPARFGVPAALVWARALHAAAWLLFGLTGTLAGAGPWYFAGVLLVGAVLVDEHRLVRPDDLSRVNQAFFEANVVISLGMFAFTLIDALTR
ncbi:menaquinone biosynthesis prenyltransferase MqnP [Oceanithermus sp.]|uniref:menaquinone biosynthesis prenyltransferase MqnP n=1 Tax=Oceanithermus sp. TaxID=2268145 RepID=UPI00257F1C39|nr:menaquinone biosynthesis prenyltransferase MqnP [Oceanithermus sp.]